MSSSDSSEMMSTDRPDRDKEHEEQVRQVIRLSYSTLPVNPVVEGQHNASVSVVTPSYHQAVADVITTITQRKPPPVLYHYTSKHALLGILKDRELHASNIRYLNDTSELRLAAEMAVTLTWQRNDNPDPEQRQFREHVQKIAWGTVPREHESFVFSLSEKDDDLPQWRAYGADGQGYSIGFDSRALIDTESRARWFLRRCFYNERDQRGLMNQVLEGAHKTFDPHYNSSLFEVLFTSTLSLLKDHRYEHEDEWRLVTFNQTMKSPRVNFKARSNLLTPYFAIPLRNPATEERAFPIKRIVVGPCCDFSLEERALRGLLVRHGGNDVEIVRSQVPYRGA